MTALNRVLMNWAGQQRFRLTCDFVSELQREMLAHCSSGTKFVTLVFWLHHNTKVLLHIQLWPVVWAGFLLFFWWMICVTVHFPKPKLQLLLSIQCLHTNVCDVGLWYARKSCLCNIIWSSADLNSSPCLFTEAFVPVTPLDAVRSVRRYVTSSCPDSGLCWVHFRTWYI